MNQENLYSRQIGTFGLETMNKLSNLKIIILHLDTIGLEIAKSLCLLGIDTLYINDQRKINSHIKGNNFSLNNSDDEFVDISTMKYLKKLNPYVKIDSVSFTKDIYNMVDMIIQTKLNNIPKYNPILINNKCRKNNIKYILTFSIGLTGYIFCDFGEKHIVLDNNGEKTKSNYIKSICYQESDNTSILELYEQTEFYGGLHFKFINSSNDISYCIEKIIDNKIVINGKIETIFLNPNNIQIYEIKHPTIINHYTLETIMEKLHYPDQTININNYDKTMEIMEELYNYIKIKLSNNFNISNINYKNIISSLYEFPVIGSILGSIVAQEVVKITNKYIPLNQELLLDYSELYVKNDLYKKCIDKTKINLYSFLPKPIIQYLKKINIFLVGCGALGCEYLKLFSMLDMACDKKSNITITDMDHIELSNLNRQFLFREEDIGKQKSFIACNKIKELNSKINIKVFDKAVGINNEHIFNRSFWEKKDIVINALDNISARQYVDNQCLLYQKPLFESGTLGTKCNIQIIIPYETKLYSETTDPSEKTIPLCTIKQFPYKIEHCIEWSIEIFNKYFNILIHDIYAILKGNEYFKNYLDKIDNSNIRNQKIKILELFKPCFINCNYKNIYTFSNNIFNILFIKSSKELLDNHPLDQLDDEGNLFWYGNKLPPSIISIHSYQKYDIFIKNFTDTLCLCLNLDIKSEIYNLKDTEVNNLNPNITIDNKIENLSIPFDEILINNINNFKYLIFEKDNDDHIQNIQLLSNIRADIYNIPNISFINCRLISGKIIPALPTTTCLVTALSTMELLKYIYNKLYTNKKIPYSDYFINMGINSYIYSEPQQSTKIISNKYNNIYGCKIKSIPEKFNKWDKIILYRKKLRIIDINDTIIYLKEIYNMNIDIISCENIILYNRYNTVNKNIKYTNVYKIINKEKTEYLLLNISMIDNMGIPIITPTILYSWN